MSAIIRGGTSGTDADVDTPSKASRVTLYDGAGNPIQPNAVYGGVAIVKVRQSAATGAGVVVWGLYNSSATVKVHIYDMWLECFFDGTAAATNMEYEVGRMTGITTFSGGAVVTPSHHRTSQSGSQVSSCRVLDTGLTTTGGAFQSQRAILAMGRVTQTTTISVQGKYLGIVDQNLKGIVMELVQNEALVIRQLVTSVIGDRIQGAVKFYEV